MKYKNTIYLTILCSFAPQNEMDDSPELQNDGKVT